MTTNQTPAAETRSIENPAVPLTSSKVLGYFGVTADGATVTPENALSLTAVWAAVQLLAGCVGMLPISAYRRLAGGGSERLPDHPFTELLELGPSPEFTVQTFHEGMMTLVLLTGNAVAGIERDEDGNPTELRVIVAPRVRRVEGEIVVTGEVAGERVRYFYSDVVHIPGLMAGGLLGLSPIRAGKTPLEAAKTADEFSKQFVANGMQLGGILTTDQVLSAEAIENLRKSWDRDYRGPSGAGKVPVLEHGLKFQPFSPDPEKAQMRETMEYRVLDVARLFGVPPHMIGEMSSATFSNIEHQALEFLKYALGRWLKRFELEYRRKAFKPEDRGDHFAKFNTNALLRGDTTTRAGFYATMLTNGVMTINEVRALEDLNPIGPEGDVNRVQLAMAPAGEADAEASAGGGAEASPAEPAATGGADGDPAEPAARSALESWALDVAGRLRARELDRLGRAVTRSDDPAAAVGAFYGSWPAGAVEAAGGLLEHVRGGEDGARAALAAYASRASAELAEVAAVDGAAGVLRTLEAWDQDGGEPIAAALLGIMEVGAWRAS